MLDENIENKFDSLSQLKMLQLDVLVKVEFASKNASLTPQIL